MAELTYWMLGEGLGREKLALLVLCTMAAYALASQLVWRLGRRTPGQERAHPGWRRWVLNWASLFVRSCYYLGIPGVALWRGQLADEMGITVTHTGSMDWVSISSLLGLNEARGGLHLGASLLFAGGTLCAMVAIWVWYAQGVLWAGRPVSSGPVGAVAWWDVLFGAVCSQLLWAFYRGTASMWISNRLYAAFGGLSLVTVTWALSPTQAARLRDPLRSPVVVQEWLCALLTAIASAWVRWLWLLVVFHLLWTWVSARVLAHVARGETFRRSARVVTRLAGDGQERAGGEVGSPREAQEAWGG